MKKTKKSFNKFTKRNTLKRLNKERQKAELLRAVRESCGVDCEGAKIRFSSDNGIRARSSNKAFRDERVARGIFCGSKSGFGFVSTDDGYDKDVFIPEDKTAHAIDGDTVEIIYRVYKARSGEEKTEGRVRKIVEYGRKTLIGTVSRESSFSYGRKKCGRLVLSCETGKLPFTPVITNAEEVKIGDKVEALIIRNKEYHGVVECSVIRNFGDADSKSANYEAILAEEGIEVDFSKEELLEAEYFASIPVTAENGRKAVREFIMTIDGEGAKDLDDAVSIRKTKDGYKLGVHIADVSYYVRERTHLDRAVMRRQTSVYFTDKVVPMLPRALSNGACSLNPNEDKYALSAFINFDNDGNILSSKIEKTVIKSSLRGVYSEVNAIFSGNAPLDIKKKYKSATEPLRKMRELYFILQEKSRKRGALTLESSEAQIVLDDNGEPIDILRRDRADAEKMIEQFMLSANEAVATKLLSEGIPCVYRVHEPPPSDKLSELVNYLHNLGFDTREIKPEIKSPAPLENILNEAVSRGISAPVSHTMLRAMSKAKYSETHLAHFGLGIENYCHFTSPIRRLSDLATHRIIHRILFEGKRSEQYVSYARRAAAAATEGELRAISAERRIENLYKVLYMQGFVGKEFDACVSSVTSFGIFCELENTCEGLVPISEMPGVFIFEEKTLSLRSKDITYRLGDSVRIRREEADISRGKLRFSIVDNAYDFK